MANLVKEALAAELKDLLAQWHALENHPAATDRDYTRIRLKIEHVCSALDQIERNEVLK